MNRRTFLYSLPAAASLSALLSREKIFAAERFSDRNEEICRQKFDLAVSRRLREKPINEVIIEIARSFLGVEYAANTIDAPGEERLLVNLQALDCVTFYENSLVLARCIKKNKLTFDDYKKELQFVRYRGGILSGYPSRLHYTSDYFFDNEKKGVLKNVSKELGGVPFTKTVNLMSGHPETYPRLKESPEFITAMKQVEAEMNARTVYYLPKQNVKASALKIKDGDIFGITTTIDGLDCTHTGLALHQNRVLHMIHAPLSGAKVQITEVPFWEYLARIKKDTGVMVARPLEP
jgi:hypothetical protein